MLSRLIKYYQESTVFISMKVDLMLYKNSVEMHNNGLPTRYDVSKRIIKIEEKCRILEGFCIDYFSNI